MALDDEILVVAPVIGSNFDVVFSKDFCRFGWLVNLDFLLGRYRMIKLTSESLVVFAGVLVELEERICVPDGLTQCTLSPSQQALCNACGR